MSAAWASLGLPDKVKHSKALQMVAVTVVGDVDPTGATGSRNRWVAPQRIETCQRQPLANPVVGERAKVGRIGHQFGFELEWAATQSHSMRVQTAEHDSTTSQNGVSIV